MKLHTTVASGRNQFTGYGAGYVAVNQQRFECSMVVTPEAIHESWQVDSVPGLNEVAVRFLLELKPEILLLGTGEGQRFPQPAVLRPLIEARIGVEVMDTAAACRTYNILMAEGRNVVAAIIV
jgi:uncharacterized protein